MLAGVFVLPGLAAARSDLATPEQRKPYVAQGEKLAAQQNPESLPKDLKDPFAPPSIRLGKVEHQTQLRSDAELMAALATQIVPSGELQLGDRPILLFREKKLKVGDYLTITFEGNDYVVEITDIQPTHFTIRFNKETLTRPINP